MHQIDHGGRPARSRKLADDLNELAWPRTKTTSLSGQSESEQTGLAQGRHGLMWKTPIRIYCVGVSSCNVEHGLNA
nr:hypothetical protein [Cryobacterium sp. TMT1-19]